MDANSVDGECTKDSSGERQAMTSKSNRIYEGMHPKEGRGLIAVLVNI